MTGEEQAGTVKTTYSSPRSCREWLAPTTTAERAEEIARDGCRPAADFKWHAVSKLVGNVRNQGPELIEPVPLPLSE